MTKPMTDRQRQVLDALKDYIADNGYPQPLGRCPAVQNGARIEQRLGGMLVRAVARVDDRRGQVASQKMRRPRGGVPHHDRVGTHDRQRIERV